MTIRNIDNLPLLTSFKAILESGSVIDAAETLGLTQSAVSKHLARLRDWLDDPLFVRTSAGLQPTPRALSVRDQVETILRATDKLMADDTPKPSTFAGEFRISATDQVLSRLLPTLVGEIAEAAPKLRLTALPLAPDYSMRDLETGAVNLLIAVNWHAPDQLKQRRLYSDRFVCLMHSSHPLADSALTIEGYAGARHILVAPLGMTEGALDAALAERGLSRKIIATVPSFSLMTTELIGRDRLATMPLRVARELANNADIRIRELPLRAPSIDYFLLWHPRFDREPRLVWIRQCVERILHD